MSGMVKDNNFLEEEDFQQNLDSLRLQGLAEDVIEELDEYIPQNYGGQVESALLTRSGHYGMSLMADSALMTDKFGYDPEAQEVADLDLCVTVSDDIKKENIPDIRNLFKKEDGSYGEFNERYEGIEINPRILHEGGLVGKLEKAAEEWRKEIPESVNFPGVDGSQTSRPPAEFMGYFHQGYTPIKQSERLAEVVEYASEVITDEAGDVYDEIWEDVWSDFRSRIEFKPGVMDENAGLGKVEMAKTNAEELDYDRETYETESGEVKKEDREIGYTGLSQKLKDQLAEDENILDWFEGEYPNEARPRSTSQQRLNLEAGPEPESSADKEVIRRRVRRFIEDHSDMEKSMRRGSYRFSFGSEPLNNYFGDDFEYELAESAVKSALGRQLQDEGSEGVGDRVNKEISEF